MYLRIIDDIAQDERQARRRNDATAKGKENLSLAANLSPEVLALNDVAREPEVEASLIHAGTVTSYKGNGTRDRMVLRHACRHLLGMRDFMPQPASGESLDTGGPVPSRYERRPRGRHIGSGSWSRVLQRILDQSMPFIRYPAQPCGSGRRKHEPLSP